MNTRSNNDLENNQLAREFIALLFLHLSSKERIDDAIIGRQSIKIKNVKSSLSDAEGFKAFNNDGSINQQNCDANNITFNLRMEIPDYQLPENLSFREQLIINAALTNAHHELTQKHEHEIATLLNELTTLNQEGKGGRKVDELEKKIAMHKTILRKIPAIVMQNMRDIHMDTPRSDVPNLNFLFNAFIFILDNNSIKFSDEYHDLFKSAARIYVGEINRCKRTANADEKNILISNLNKFVQLQIELIQQQWPLIQNTLVRGQPNTQLMFARDTMITLSQVLEFFKLQIGPLPPGLKTSEIILNKIQFDDYLKDYIESKGLDLKYATTNPETKKQTLQNDINKLLAMTSNRIHTNTEPKPGSAMVKRYQDLIDIGKDLDDLARAVSSRLSQEQLTPEQTVVAEKIQRQKNHVTTQKTQIESTPEWQDMLFLMTAKEYLTSPERKWNVGYQWKPHTLPGTNTKIPGNVAKQLKEIEEAEKTGQFKSHKEKFLEIGIKKASSSLLSSGPSNSYFQLFKDNDGHTPEGDPAKKELEDKLGKVFRSK